MTKTQDRPRPVRPGGPRPGGPSRPGRPQPPSKEALDERIGQMRDRIERMEARQAAVPAAEEKPQIYVVKAGDSLSKIAKALLGDAKRWPEILEANKDKIKDADAIRPGQELVIPKK